VKTISLKKVSAVAVASLGFGLLSVVPAHADAVTAEALFTSISLSKVTAAPTTGAAVEFNLGGVSTTAAGETAGDTIAIRSYLKSYPSGGFVQTSANATAAGTDTEFFVPANIAEAASGGVYTITLTAVTGTTAGTVLGSATNGAAKFSFNPSKAGSYELVVWVDSDGDGVQDLTETSQNALVTVAAASGWSTGGTTVFAAGATANTLATAATDLVPKAASSVLGTKAASILVTLRDTDGALYTGQTVTATVSGPGFVGTVGASVVNGNPVTGTQQDTGDGTATTTRTVSLTDTTGYVAIGVWADGTAGTSSIAISVTDKISGATTVVATKTVTFYGDVAKLEIVKSNFKIGKAGSTTGAADGNLAARNLAGEVTNAGALNASTTTPSIILKATDSGGRVANTVAAPTVVSSNGNVVSGGTCVLDDGLDATYSSGGTGFYNCNFDTAASAASGNAAKLTFRIADPADATLFITTATSHDVTVGGSVSTETITFDKTAYAPGEAMVVTRTAKDSAGNPVADGTAAPALTFSKAVGGTAPGASTYIGGTRATSATAPTVFAPAIAGAFTVTATSGNAAGSTLTASASVTDASAAVLTQIDALNAKIVALNALIAKIMKKLGVK
jgi:hypothetical protein